jgi:hypothetical protein
MVSKFSDVAVGLSEDRLGFRDYADGVIATLESISKEDTPFTIGIFGSWGSGKTSFMQIMRELLERKGYKTIFFKSWEYGNEEKPWIPFMIKVVDELFEKGLDKKELIRNVALFSTDVALQTYSQGKVSTGVISNLIERSRKNMLFKNWLDKDTRTVIERVTKIEEFKKRINERAEKSENGKIIIFIDDLDRIPEKIVDFLNSLKTFLDIRGCIFVLGCDYKILDSALKQRYEGAIYEDYFDKIVQTEFYIPKISEQAIKNYLQFLTGWNDDKELEKCTQLVIHSIGGNPRKIKRMVNATMLIKSVFERRLATLLQAFESPKPRMRIERMGEGKEEEIEEPMALGSEIPYIFPPPKAFGLLFDKKVLFKLVCMREQWPIFYENILSEEKKQDVLISLQDSDITTDMSKLLGTAKEIDISELFSATKEQGDKLKQNVENFSIFLNDYPRFQGVEDLKTYLTLLEISSPEACIFLEYTEPEKLPISLFNRYMLFERINKGKVDERIIEKKINQMDWESDLSAYHFFIEVISAFRYNYLLIGLLKNEKNLRQIAKKIRDSTDLVAIGQLLFFVGYIEEETARELLNQTKDTYAEKIRDSTDPVEIRRLLRIVRETDKNIARELLNQTKDTYVEKIIASTDPEEIGWLLGNVSRIDKDQARELLRETKDAYAEKIRDSTDPEAIGVLLDSARETDENTARDFLNETKGAYPEKIVACTDPMAIGWLLGNVSRIDKDQARKLLRKTKDAYAEKIRDSTDPNKIGRLLLFVGEIDEGTARELLNQTKDTYAKKIRDSTDPEAIGVLLDNVREIDEETARELLNETKDTYAEKIRDCTYPGAIEELFDSVEEIDEETARELLNETKNMYAEKIRDSTNLFAIGWLLDNMRGIEEETARELLNGTKNTIAEKIRASTDPDAIGALLESVREIDEETAKWLEEETKFKSK